MRKIEKLERETLSKQVTLEQVHSCEQILFYNEIIPGLLYCVISSPNMHSWEVLVFIKYL